MARSTNTSNKDDDHEDSQDGMQDRDRPLYMISVAAELTGMHPQTLRVYEQKGLVTPGRSRGNTRLYSQADIDRLNLISKLTDEGINLAGVVRILDMRERAEEKDAEIDELRKRVRELEDEVHELKTRERITSLAHYDGSTPEKVMRGLLDDGDDVEVDDGIDIADFIDDEDGGDEVQDEAVG